MKTPDQITRQSAKKRTDVMKNSPFRDKKGRMPLWIEIEAEIDFFDFELKNIAKDIPKSPIGRMIDEATGYSEHRIKSIKKIVKRMIIIKKALEKETGKKQDIELEERILFIFT